MGLWGGAGGDQTSISEIECQSAEGCLVDSLVVSWTRLRSMPGSLVTYADAPVLQNVDFVLINTPPPPPPLPRPARLIYETPGIIMPETYV